MSRFETTFLTLQICDSILITEKETTLILLSITIVMKLRNAKKNDCYNDML